MLCSEVQDVLQTRFSLRCQYYEGSDSYQLVIMLCKHLPSPLLNR